MRSLRRTSAVLALALAALSVPAIAAPPTTAFTYQGELKQDGQTVTATLPMTFSLFTAANGGTQLAQINKAAVQVDAGRFTEPLDFPVATLNSNQALWLEVVVNGVTLSQRQQITGAAYSLSTRGITVDAQNRVGIGTTTPNRKLSVVGGMDVYDGNGQGIAMVSNALSFQDANEDPFYRFSGATQSHTFSTNGTDCVTIDSAGRLGVGTDTPTAALHVQAPAGDASVKLPASSIGAAELASEPGVAAIRSQTAVALGLQSTVILSRTITAPDDGYLVALGTGVLSVHDQPAYINMVVDGVEQGALDVHSLSAVNTRYSPSTMRVIPVTAGTHTVEWTGYTVGSGSALMSRPNLVVMYFPTGYGEVVP